MFVIRLLLAVLATILIALLAGGAMGFSSPPTGLARREPGPAHICSSRVAASGARSCNLSATDRSARVMSPSSTPESDNPTMESRIRRSSSTALSSSGSGASISPSGTGSNTSPKASRAVCS